jgi:CubicO group peptidase (beta-lactamase class C family)
MRALLLVVSALFPLMVPAQSRGITDAALASAVDSLAASLVARGVTPALGIAIVRDGRTILARGHGTADRTRNVPVRDNTLWYVASTSKSFTGVATMLLVAEGAIALDAPITGTVPTARWHPSVSANALTLARFLTHTHHLDDGVVVWNAAFTGAQPETAWPQLRRFSAPSNHTDLEYSNLGYNVAAMAIDAVRPEGWRTFMAQRVFTPLGMRDTHVRLSGLDRSRIAMPHDRRPDGSMPTMPFLKVDATMNSAGGHLSTVHDLARWITAQMDSGRIDGQQLLPAAAVTQSHTLLARHTRDAARRFAMFDRTGWGAGWDLGAYDGEPMVSRFGSYSTTRSHVSFLPARRVGVVAMTNGRFASSATDIVAAYAYDLAAGRRDARARATERVDSLQAEQQRAGARVAASDSARAARQRPLLIAPALLTGRYHHEGLGTFTLRADGDRVRWQWGVLEGVAEVFDAAVPSLRVEISASGYVVTIEHTQGTPQALRLEQFRFVRVP